MFALLDNFDRENMRGLFEKRLNLCQNKKFTTRQNLVDMLNSLNLGIQKF